METLPKSDTDFWEGEKYTSTGKKVGVCDVHTKDNWMNGEYFDNKDGTITCVNCSWGCMLPGYYRVKDRRIVDLRTLNSPTK